MTPDIGTGAAGHPDALNRDENGGKQSMRCGVSCSVLYERGSRKRSARVILHYIMKTRLGQKFRAVGQNRVVANASGINVDSIRIIAIIISTVLAGWGQILFMQSEGIGTFQAYSAHEQVGLYAGAAILVGGASIDRATNIQALLGTFLFHFLFITAMSAATKIFGDSAIGEYFRAFISYGIIALALVIYTLRASKSKNPEAALKEAGKTKIK